MSGGDPRLLRPAGAAAVAVPGCSFATNPLMAADTVATAASEVCSGIVGASGGGRLLPFPWAPPRVGKRLVGKGGKRRWELPRRTRVSQRAHFGGTAGHLFGGKGAASAQLLASRTAAFREAQDGLDKSVLCGSNKWRTKQYVSRQCKHRCMRPDTSLRDGHQYALIMSHAYESNITNILSNSTHQLKRTHNISIWPCQAGGREGCPPFLIFSDFFFFYASG